MPFTRRPLTPVEQTKPCPWCDAQPGQRCTNPNGSLFQPGVHSARRTGRPVGRPSGRIRDDRQRHAIQAQDADYPAGRQ